MNALSYKSYLFVFQLTFIFAMISYSPAEYDGKAIPAWAEFLGWLMVLLPILCVLGRALKILLYRKIPVSNSFICILKLPWDEFSGRLMVLLSAVCVLGRAFNVVL